MPQLVKLQNELKDTGFAIIGLHSQAGGAEDVASFGRQYKISFTLTNSGSVPGHDFSGLPMQFLFDTKGNLVDSGNHITHKKIQDLVASEPHFLAAGRSYTKHKAEAEALKKSKIYAPILKKLEKDLSGTGEAADEAKYLSTRIRAYGTKKLEEAKATEEESPYLAQLAYTEISTNWKGDETGDKAAARLKEMKGDKAFQEELKASELLQQIVTECEKLIAQGGKINLDYAVNQKIASGVKARAAVLKKKHPESKASKSLAKVLEPFGFKGI